MGYLVSAHKKGLPLGSFANLGALKTSKISHFPTNGTSTLDKVISGTQDRSLRPGTSFGVCSRLFDTCHFHIVWPYP